MTMPSPRPAPVAWRSARAEPPCRLYYLYCTRTQVVKCHDFKTSQLRAIKIIRNKKRFHAQALVELRILQHLTDADVGDKAGVVHILVSIPRAGRHAWPGMHAGAPPCMPLRGLAGCQ